MPDTVITSPRDWGMLASWLEAEWRGTDPDAHPHLHGLYEAFFTVADAMRGSSPEARENCLYSLLASSLTSSGHGEDAEG